ncbi:SGS-domain-containing protein [Neoconidiobolus thromboides FSU 785]|nr:SGS-domain-containing protein [Neoconidiobolus thromboides FSU 785]
MIFNLDQHTNTTPDPRLVQAEDYFKSSDYENALNLYNDILRNKGLIEEIDLLYKKGLCLYHLKRREEALVDITKVILTLEKKKPIDKKLLAEVYYRKGLLLFELTRYPQALKAYKKAEQLGYKNDIKELIQQVEPMVPKDESNKDSIETIKPKDIKTQPKPAPVEQKREVIQPKPVGFSIPDKIRHEWYQTDSSVIVSIFIKKADAKKTNVEFKEKEFTLIIQQDNSSDFQFTIDPLLNEIDPKECKFEVLSTKIEITLKKVNFGLKWSALEASEETLVKKATTDAPRYPSSSKNAKNWDQLATKIEKELAEEEKDHENVNAAFQQIYANADDDTRKAMMKSYIESNGTSLSTNWEEVSKKKMEINPPDGLVAKKWE